MRARPVLSIVSLLGLSLAASGGCSSGPTSTPGPSQAPPCVTRLGSSPSQDLLLEGSEGCPGTVGLSLRVATGALSAPTWSNATQGPLRVEGEWTAIAQGAIRPVRVRNTTSAPVDLVGLEWAAEGLDSGADRFLHQGYQSWSYTGVEAIPASLADALGTAPRGGDEEDVLGEIAGVSWWVGARMDARGQGLVAGADGARVFKTRVAVDGRRLRLVVGVEGGALRVAPGEARELDGLFVRRGEVSSGLDEYAAHVARAHPPPASPRRRPLGGWGSWNMYYEKISADILRPEIAFTARRLAPLSLDTFLVDDGYEPHWGAWRASPGFGADLSSFVAEQTRERLVPALWLAPVYVDLVDPVVTEHPDWFVRRADGSPRTYDAIGSTRKAALDVTHPEARAFALEQMKRLWASGVRVFKLDFLFGAGLDGTHKEPVTAMQSYSLWLKAIRDALPEAHLVGCGAPLLPSVGTFDSMRIGPDVAFFNSPTPHYPFLATQARSIALRGFTDAWWALDPDVVLLRGERITDADAWTVVVMSAMSGGNYLLGDGRQAGELRLTMALDPEILELTRSGQAARPLDLGAELDPKLTPSPLFALPGDVSIPHVWTRLAPGGPRAIAVFGWSSDDHVSELELPPDTMEITPPRAPGARSGKIGAGGRQRVQVAPREARLFLSRSGGAPALIAPR